MFTFTFHNFNRHFYPKQLTLEARNIFYRMCAPGEPCDLGVLPICYVKWHCGKYEVETTGWIMELFCWSVQLRCSPGALWMWYLSCHRLESLCLQRTLSFQAKWKMMYSKSSFRQYPSFSSSFPRIKLCFSPKSYNEFPWNPTVSFRGILLWVSAEFYCES